MNRIFLVIGLSSLSTVAALVAVGTTSSACVITSVAEGEGEGEGAAAGEGEGAAAGEGEGEGTTGAEASDAACGDGVDNDGNGFTDCADFSCAGFANCKETACTTGNCCGDGIDNDNNTFVDCEDFACSGNGSTIPTDPACSVTGVSLQSIQDGDNGDGFTVTTDAVVVTGTKVAGSGNVTLFVQEANGVGNGQTYPEFSGLEVFIQSASVATLPDVNGLAVGDCVSSLAGKVAEHSGQTQITFVTALTKGGGCGAAPVAAVKNVADINDSGADSEKFEGVLVTVNDVTVSQASSGTSGSFEVQDSTNAALFVSGFLLATAPNFAVGAHFTSITGILNEFDDDTTTPATVRFNLDPASAADLVQ